jgi:type I site-specific restriction-modification system R (restriction) subunit
LLEKENLKLLLTKYCTVSEKTEEQMKKLEDSFRINVTDINTIIKNQDLIQFIPDRNIRRKLKEVIRTNKLDIEHPEKIQKIVDQMFFTIYKNRLNNSYKSIYTKIIDLYKNDELVKKRLINPYNYLNTLKPYFNEMTLIHKEGMDIIALNKDLKKYDVKIENRIYHKDIAVYNDIFRKKYNTAKLYESYLCLNTEFLNKHPDLKQFESVLEDKIKEKMPIIKAHNPLSDTYFTVFVFLIMEKYYKN